MSATHLAVVPVRDVESIAQKVRRLQADARSMARDHVDMLRSALADVSRLAGEIAEGGESYPVGAREMARRLADEAASQSLTLSAINERANA